MNPTQPASQTPVEQYDHIQAMIPTKNMPSLLAYYFGVFGLIPLLGLPLSVTALVLGIIGLRQYKEQPTPGAKVHAIIGLVLGIVQIAVFIAFLVYLIVGTNGILPPDPAD